MKAIEGKIVVLGAQGKCYITSDSTGKFQQNKELDTFFFSLRYNVIILHLFVIPTLAI